MDHAPDTPAPDLRISGVVKRFGDIAALDDARLDVARGELISILGPSGCGKSTLLQLIAGHIAPDAGSIEIAGVVVAGPGVLVPAQRRDVGLVFQDYALFPHLTVLENVAYGARRGDELPGVARRGLARVRARQHRRDAATAVLDQLEISALATRYPGELSGGQQQRVAIARAIAQRPRLLLLDEPFCNLDAGTREHVRSEIVELLRATGLTCVFVTHDQEEALAVSDRVAVMQAGRVVQVDDPETLYRRPFCLDVAEFLGRTNVLRGRAHDGRVETEVGSFELPGEATGDVQVIVRPELIDVRASQGGGAVVVGREFRGHDVLYTLRMPSGELVWAHRPSIDMVDIGDRVELVAQRGPASLVDGAPDDAAAQSPAPPSPAEPGDRRPSFAAADGLMTSSQSGSAELATSTSAGNAASR
jgi:iron(III) transport system ATP-binding protein